MYAVVGCNRCDALWVVDGRPKTTSCPRCGKRHQTKKLKRFYEAETSTEAKDARSRLLAQRGGYEDQAAELDGFETLGHEADRVGVSDEEYLEGSGIDSDAVAAAGARADEAGKSTSRSKRQVVLDAFEELDRPTEAEVKAYAAQAGVGAEYVEKALSKLSRAGELSESGGRYRRL
jgi:hypothetical protein